MSRQLSRLVWACLFTWIVSAALVTAQQPAGKDEKKEPTKEPGKVEAAKEPTKQASEAPATIFLRLNNGTALQDVILLDTIEMDTKLGKLSIPASEVRRIDFGFRLSAEDTKTLEQALKDLASDKHANREVATKTLTKMGKLAYPALMERRKGGDLEMTRRVEELLKEIKGRYPAESLTTRRTDVLKTADSSVAGLITSETLTVKCEVFGTNKIPLWRLRELRSTSPGGEILVAIDAGKHGHNQAWLITEFDMTPGTRVDITASGEINLDPMNRLGGIAQARNVTAQGTPNLTSGEMFIPGQLVGRIGPDGPQFLIGKALSVNPTREGKLYLRVITIWHADKIQAEGNYQVRIVADPTGEPVRAEPMPPRFDKKFGFKKN